MWDNAGNASDLGSLDFSSGKPTTNGNAAEEVSEEQVCQSRLTLESCFFIIWLKQAAVLKFHALTGNFSVKSVASLSCSREFLNSKCITVYGNCQFEH